jgi:OOP family OmpA-OmpF porin
MKKMMTAAVAVLAFAAAGAAQAEGYIGAGVGATHGNLDCAGATTCDTSDTGGKVFGGYKFSPNLAAEAGYISFGQVKGADSTGSASYKSQAFYLGVALMGDFSPEWTGVARLGVASTKVDAEGHFAGFTVTDSGSNTDAYVGLGLGYRVSKQFTIGLDADFTNVKLGGDKMSVRMLGVSGTYSF